MALYQLLQQAEQKGNPVRVGLIGAGTFGTTFLAQLRLTPGMRLVGIAELDLDKARQSCLRTGWSQEALLIASSTDDINGATQKGKVALTNRSDQLIQADLDVILEITGITEAGTRHAWDALDAGKHVILVNVETDVLLGSALRKKADQKGLVYSLAFGDQPAIICELIDWARTVGFEVVCAGKGTYYQPEFHYSTPETVWDYFDFPKEWLASGTFNAQMYNSFLDGTKSAIEMCAVANASGLVPQKRGLQFPPVGADDLQNVLKPVAAGGILEHGGTVEVIACDNRDRTPVKRNLRWGVYVVFRAPTEFARRQLTHAGVAMDSSGEYAALSRPFHLIGLELGVSVASAALRREATGSAGTPVADVASTAKKDLKPRDVLDGEGGYTVYGRLTRAEDSMPNRYLPIGLSRDAKMVRPVAKDVLLTYDDVELDETQFSYRIRKTVEEDFLKHRSNNRL
jgi:predicted homoserine dehydrogenase-like protein